MPDTATRLQTLMERMEKVKAEIASTTAEAEAEKAINSIGGDLAGYIVKSAIKSKVDIKALHGKFFALTVGDDGKLAVALASKVAGNGKKKATTTTSGQSPAGEFEYFLKDGQGPYATIQEVMAKMNIPEANRPKHNRYDRLSKDWQGKIDRKPKAAAAAPAAAAAAPAAPPAAAPAAAAPATPPAK